jgi:parvulin-like peptidyl-prolyl isomerase
MTRLLLIGLLGTAVGFVPTVAMAQTTPPPVGQVSPPPAPAPVATAAQPPLIIQRVLVKVNGQAFTQTDLEQAQTDALAQKNMQANVKTAPTDAALQAQLLQITPGILVDAINDMLMIEKAHELGYKMSDDQFQKFIDNIKADNNIKDDAGFKKALVDQGLTMEQLRKNLEHEYLRRAVQQSEIMKGANMTDEEARQYYKAHTTEFMVPAKVVLREILVAVSTTSVGGQASFNAGADETARDKATAIHDRLVKGEDFAKVAAEVSDSGTKQNGGLLGDVNVADMSDTLRPIIEALKAGDFTAPIRTQRGYQILKLDSRAAEQPKPFEDVRDVIAQKIYEQRLSGEEQKYLDKLRGQALIEWKDQNLKDMYDKQVASAKKPGTGVSSPGAQPGR